MLKGAEVPELLDRSFRTGNNSCVKPEQEPAKSDNDGPEEDFFPLHMAIQFRARYPLREGISFEMIPCSIKIVLLWECWDNVLVISEL